jgi:hypothetical protein
MSYVQQPVPRRRRFVPQGIPMRQATYPGLGLRHRVPVRLGANLAPLAASAPTVAAGVGTQAAVSAGIIGAGSALSVAIPVAGAALAVVVGALLAAHAKRVADAKSENQNLTDLIPTVINAISQVFQQANSGAATPAQAIAAMQQIQQGYWQSVAAFENAPGQAGGPSKCANLSFAQWSKMTTNPTACDKSCTASCCIGCNVINQWVTRAVQMFQTGKSNDGWAWGSVIGNKYGLSNFSPPNWSYTPVAGVTTQSAAATSAQQAVSGAVQTVTTGNILGIPLWLILVVGGVGIWWAMQPSGQPGRR